jgi:hypothetical protein
MNKLTLLETDSYSFADYFRLNIAIDQLTNYFGYNFKREYYSWPRSNRTLERIEDLRLRLQQNTLHTSQTSEIARREFLIAPILTEIIIYTHSNIRVEFPLVVNNKLKGTLDYLIQGQQQLLVIEAKNADLEQGFIQLVAELIALDYWLDDTTMIIYGAVTIGNIWQFGLLQRENKLLIQDVNLFRVPADIEELLSIMLNMLQTLTC